MARVTLSPTSQSASARQTAERYRGRYARPSFRLANPSRMALSVWEEIHSRLIGLRNPALSRIHRATSSPSPPRVSGDDQGVDFLAMQPGFYHAELLGGFRDHLEGHLFRHHGQAVQAPGLVLAAVMLRLRQLHQVPQRPGHHILRPGHVPASAAMAAQHPGDFLAHRRLFRQYQRLSHRYPAFLSSIVAYSPPVFHRQSGTGGKLSAARLLPTDQQGVVAHAGATPRWRTSGRPVVGIRRRFPRSWRR